MPSTNRLLSIWRGLAETDRWSDFVAAEDLSCFERRSLSEGPEFYARELSKLRKDFLFSLEKGQFSTTARFGLKKDSVLPRFLYKAFAAVFSDDGFMLSYVNVDAVTCVNQLTAVFTKIKGGHTPESESVVIQKFINTELEMKTFRLDEALLMPRWVLVDGAPVRVHVPLGEILTDASHRIKRVLAGSDPREISPKHGSGAAADGSCVHERYAVPRYVKKIDALWPMSDYYFASMTAFCDHLDEYLSAPVLDPCAKVILVPKDARGPRLISCEPPETMWIQQGLMHRFYDDIEGHSLTRGSVNFTDQTYNQVAAYSGSRDHGMHCIKRLCELKGADLQLALLALTGPQRDAIDAWRRAELSTAVHFESRGLFPRDRDDDATNVASLDLSDASDWLHLHVVDRLFPSNWSEALNACRSAQTMLPDGSLVPLSKHAPMGSAVCFPVMALVIWSVLTAIAPKHARKSILVYGDDIIVPSYMAEDAMRVLESIGFVVNRTKSFYKGPFRESCGEEFFRGCRVTPVYLRTNPDDDTQSKLCMYAFCNNLLQCAACTSNNWMIDLLHEWYGDCIPVSYLAMEHRADWIGYAESAHVAHRYAYSTLSGVVYTDDWNRVRKPSIGSRSSRRCERTQVRQYRILVPEPLCIKYDTGDWSHVLRALVNPAQARLGCDPVHNRVRYVYRWCSLD